MDRWKRLSPHVVVVIGSPLLNGGHWGARSSGMSMIREGNV